MGYWAHLHGRWEFSRSTLTHVLVRSSRFIWIPVLWDYGHYNYTWDPVSDRLTKRTIPEYTPPFFSPKYFPIHIMYYQIQKADRPAIRDTDHTFSVPNHKRTRKTDQQKKSFTLSQLYMHQLTWLRDQLRMDSLMGPAVTRSTKGPALA